MSYPLLKEGASCFIAIPCPSRRGRWRSFTSSEGGSHPDSYSYSTPAGAHEGPPGGAEAYLTNPRFNRGVSVTLTPLVTVVDMLIVNHYLNFTKRAIHPRLREASFPPLLNPLFYNPYL
ncbi:MAG: hypothetical protein ACP5IE_02700 [Infirmifilum sp.]